MLGTLIAGGFAGRYRERRCDKGGRGGGGGGGGERGRGGGGDEHLSHVRRAHDRGGSCEGIRVEEVLPFQLYLYLLVVSWEWLGNYILIFELEKVKSDVDFDSISYWIFCKYKL